MGAAEEEDDDHCDVKDVKRDSATRTSAAVGAHIPKTTQKKKSTTFVEVNSSYHQRYGAVACQIYARGVHTALRLDCVVSEDNQYCFASALRGNMECVAIHIGALDAFLSHPQMPPHHHHRTAAMMPRKKSNLLDYIHVDRHSDAKLRGLGACTLLACPTNTGNNNHHNSPRYLLLTGKSIKNIHIWSFQPPSSDSDEPIWQCLYDCPTNGNTIQWLAFRRAWDDPTDNELHEPLKKYKLQALSKSLHQKLRVWDISQEEVVETVSMVTPETPLLPQHQQRRARPPYQDIPNTESALGIAGNWIICGGELFDNQISIVSLENTFSHHQHSSSMLYNHTELALPASTATTTTTPLNHTATSTTDQRRQQRGDMKCIVSVSGIQNHVVLELSDGTVAEYRVNNDGNESDDSLTIGSSSGITMVPTIEKLPDSASSRQLSLQKIVDAASNKISTVALIAAYQQSVGRGTITIQSLIQNQSKLTDPPTTMVKAYPPITKDEQQVTPTPLHSKTKTTTLASCKTIGSVHSTAKVNVVTTSKKPRKAIHSSEHTNISLPMPGQPALVTTIKKKKLTTKEKGQDDSVAATTPIPTDSSMIIPKKQRNKISVSASVTQNDHLTPMNVDVSSFTTPFPKAGLPSFTNDTDTTLHMLTNDGDDNNNDNYLATIYEKTSTNTSAIKRFTPTPLSWNHDLSTNTTNESTSIKINEVQSAGTNMIPADKDHEIAAAPSRNDEPSPPIPRKRNSTILTASAKQKRRNSLSTKQMDDLKSTDVVTSSSEASPVPARTVLQNLTPNINKKSIPVLEEVQTDTSKNSSSPSNSIESPNPTTNVRDRITALCHDKLCELEFYENEVRTLRNSFKLTPNKPCSTNPYEKQYETMRTHHYMCHVQIRKRIIDATRQTIYSIMDAPVASSLDKAKAFLYSALISFQKLSVRYMDHESIRHLSIVIVPFSSIAPSNVKDEMVLLQQSEAYPILALHKQYSALCLNVTPSPDVKSNDIDIDEEISFAFPTLFQDVMTFLPVLD
jgi:hypothetical protein